MERGNRTTSTIRFRSAWWVGALLVFLGSRDACAQGWSGYGRDSQHSCLAVSASQLPQRIRWSTKVDLNPVYSGGELLIHYGSPLITRVNTVLLPVKTGQFDGFQIEAHRASDGVLIWTQATDYSLPAHNWVPTCGMTLTPKDRYLAFPGAGGTIFLRTFPDSALGTTTRVAFFGTANYASNPAAFNSAIQICTPISSDKLGNLFFGYVSSGAALPGFPNGIPSGLARISSTGVGSFIAARDLSGDNNTQKVAYNCAPAFSTDNTTAYVAVNGNNGGYLCALNGTTLARQNSVFLLDPRSTATAPLAAWVSDDGSATPTVGPDGDVYYGVLENGFPSNHARGWLLHFDGTLAPKKFASAFGWDDTASVVPASLVPQYTGTSSYLLLTKFNNYGGAGGDGVNKLAIVDPNNSMVDPVTGATVMNTVITVAGITPDPSFRPALPNAVREWCINSAAIDPVNKCAVVNSEDGNVYRWDFASNSLSAPLLLAPPTGEAYTPTVIGPDGAIYAINNAQLFSCVSN